MIIWCPREESDPHLKLRRFLFYPLNYEGKLRLLYQKLGKNQAILVIPNGFCFGIFPDVPINAGIV